MAATEGSWCIIGCDLTAFPHSQVVEESCSNRMKCAICLQTMSDPVSIPPCGHMYDRRCIQGWMMTNGVHARCPKGCPVPITTLVAAPDMKQLIREAVKAHCPNPACTVITSIDAFAPHVKSHCDHTRFRCTLHSSDGRDCGAEVTRTGKAAHEEVCPYVAVQCGHAGCRKRLLRTSMDGHMASCDMRPVVCKCGVIYTKRNERQHQQVCSEFIIPCPICTERVVRCRMDAHMSSSSALHVSVLFDKNMELERTVRMVYTENKALQEKMAYLEERLDGLSDSSTSVRAELKKQRDDLKLLEREVIRSVHSVDKEVEKLQQGQERLECRLRHPLTQIKQQR